MAAWLDWIFPETLLAHGRSAVVDSLRSAADALHALADAVDASVAAAEPRDTSDPGTGPPPGVGTRERIGEALQRARSRYDAVSDDHRAPPRTH